MIKVMILGRLGKDPENKISSNGKPYTSISIASDEGKNKDGTKRTTWVTVFFWDKLADLAQRYLHKGSLVYAECNFKTTEKGYLLDAKQLIFLDQGRNAPSSSIDNTPSDEQNHGLNASANHIGTNASIPQPNIPMSDFDDIPF